MKQRKAEFQSAADLFATWQEDVLTGGPPVFYPIGVDQLERIEIGPGRVAIFGGPPGGSKTAFVMQATVDALRMTDELRACVCNVEMPPRVLMDRQLARISGVDLDTIRYRRFEAEHHERIDRAMNTLEPLMERLCFVKPPFDLENVAAAADEFEADLLLLDYIQRIPAPGRYNDRRGAIDATMGFLRQFADNGVAVMVVAAVSRTKDSKGRSSYAAEGLNLASFRESSELEFGADDAFMLAPEPGTNVITLRHLKGRYSECRDLPLVFHGPCQRFTSISDSGDAENKHVKAELASIWQRTSPAKEEIKEETS